MTGGKGPLYASFLIASLLVCIDSGLAAQSPPNVGRIVIEKSKHTLSLMNGTKFVKSYKVALGAQPVESVLVRPPAGSQRGIAAVRKSC